MSNNDTSVYDFGDGLYVTSEGEIVSGSEDGALAVAASRIAGWQEQVRAYEAAIGAGKALLMKRMTSNREVAGGYVISLRQNSRKVLNLAAVRDELTGSELTTDEWRELVFAATGFDASLLDAVHPGLITDHIDEIPNRPYVLVTPTLKDAPQPLRMPRPDSAAQ